VVRIDVGRRSAIALVGLARTLLGKPAVTDD
jgi:hypothetical protein